MKAIKSIVIIVFIIIIHSKIYSQERLLNPSITFLELSNTIEAYNCPTFNIDEELAQFNNDQEAEISPLTFAHEFETNFSPSNIGTWTESDGLRIWRLKIKSNNAKSMSIIFEDLNLPPYSSLFIYKPDLSIVFGPYTNSYTSNTTLPSPLLLGDELVIELVYDIDMVRDDIPSFAITSITHDFVGMAQVLYGIQEDKFTIGKILGCHNDVICPIAIDWQLTKKSVARMVDKGKEVCTGALINNPRCSGC